MNEKPTYEQLEQLVRDQKEKISDLENLLNVTPDMVCIVNIDGYFKYLNPEWEKVLGFSKEELCSRQYVELIHPEDREDTEKEVKKQLEGGLTFNFQNRYRSRNGNYRLLQWRATPSEGNQLFAVARDITESKVAKEKLKRSETRFRNLIEGSIQGILIHHHHKPLFVNQAWASIHGYSVDEVLKMESIIPLIASNDQKRMTEYKDLRLRSEFAPSNYEYLGVRKDGSKVWLGNRVMLVEWDGQPALQSIIVDITERKKTEKQLLEINTIFLSLLENSPIYIFFKDHHLRPVYLSRNYEKMLGLPLENIIGKKMSELFPSELAESMEEADRGVLSGGKLVQIDETLNDRHFTTIKFPIFLPDRPSMLAGITIDITDRRKLEEERDRFKSQFYQSQKFEAIGTLAGGIAHDFNNILSSMIGFAQLAMAEAPAGSQQLDDLQEVYIAGQRAKELVIQILAFARQSEVETKPVRLRDIVTESLKLLRPSTPTTVEIIPVIESNSSVIGNTSQLSQVVMNLCTNAIFSLQSKGGILEIGLKNTSLAIEHDFATPGLPAGEYVELTVSDNGPGIDPSIMTAVFDPYFTTKNVGEGTGMGLATVKGIIESHGGDIQVKSQPDQNTVFTVRLPVVKSGDARAVWASGQIDTGTGRILFVDDEPPLARLGSRMLEQLGYSVITRTSSFEALMLFEKKPDDFDLVITDMTMPAMTGDILSSKILEIRPDIPIILCTGYSNKMSEEKAKRIGIDAFIFKPFSKSDLSRIIREVFDAS